MNFYFKKAIVCNVSSPSKPFTIARSVGVQVQTEDKIKGRIEILTLQNHKIGDDDFFVKPISRKLPTENKLTNEDELKEKIQSLETELNIERDNSRDLKWICEDNENKIIDISKSLSKKEINKVCI